MIRRDNIFAHLKSIGWNVVVVSVAHRIVSKSEGTQFR